MSYAPGAPTSGPSATRPCSRCGEQHGRRGRSRWHSYCLKCHAANMRTWRPKYRDLSPDQKRKARTRSRTCDLVKRGAMARRPCVRCGSASAQAHHTDYDDARTVVWLCRRCHLREHGAID